MKIKALALPGSAAIVVAIVAIALSQGGAGASGPASNAVVAGKAAQLTIANFAYHPAVMTVRVGAIVTVTNKDSTAHTATATSGAFDSGTIQPGHSARLRTTHPGTYAYYCQFHAFMHGTIKVVR